MRAYPPTRTPASLPARTTKAAPPHTRTNSFSQPTSRSARLAHYALQLQLCISRPRAQHARCRHSSPAHPLVTSWARLWLASCRRPPSKLGSQFRVSMRDTARSSARYFGLHVFSPFSRSARVFVSGYLIFEGTRGGRKRGKGPKNGGDGVPSPALRP